MRYILYFLVYSCLVVGLFVTLLYLMTVVDPGLMQLPEKAVKMMKANSEGVQDSAGELFENVIFDDVPSVGDQSQYGLEKIDVDNIEMITLDPPEQEELVTSEEETKNYSIWKYTPRKVVPPVWPSTPFVQTVPTNTAISKVTSNQTHGLDKSEVKESEALPIKGHRRSISSLKNDNDKSAIVILKIIDNSGESRIEIKIGSEKSSRRRKNKDNKRPLKNKSKFSMSLQTNNNDQIKKRVLSKNTIISIMPNDTIVVDEYERILSEKKEKTKEIMQIEGNIKNVISSEDPLFDATNRTVHNITDYEDVLFTKNNDNISIGTTEMIVHKDIYTLTLSKDEKTNSEENVFYTTGVSETEPSNILNTDEDFTTFTTFEISSAKPEDSIMPKFTSKMTDLQSENVLNNDISNTVLDDFNGIQHSTEESIATTNTVSDVIVSELITAVNSQDVNLMNLLDNTNVQIESSLSPATDLTIANVQSFDLLSKLDALSENTNLTEIEPISHEDNISVPITEPIVKIQNSTILTTNLTFQDELQMATITNVAIQNDNLIVLPTNQNEDLVLTATDSTGPNETANVENKTENNLVE